MIWKININLGLRRRSFRQIFIKSNNLKRDLKETSKEINKGSKVLLYKVASKHFMTAKQSTALNFYAIVFVKKYLQQWEKENFNGLTDDLLMCYVPL